MEVAKKFRDEVRFKLDEGDPVMPYTNLRKNKLSVAQSSKIIDSMINESSFKVTKLVYHFVNVDSEHSKYVLSNDSKSIESDECQTIWARQDSNDPFELHQILRSIYEEVWGLDEEPVINNDCPSTNGHGIIHSPPKNESKRKGELKNFLTKDSLKEKSDNKNAPKESSSKEDTENKKSISKEEATNKSKQKNTTKTVTTKDAPKNDSGKKATKGQNKITDPLKNFLSKDNSKGKSNKMAPKEEVVVEEPKDPFASESEEEEADPKDDEDSVAVPTVSSPIPEIKEEIKIESNEAETETEEEKCEDEQVEEKDKTVMFQDEDGYFVTQRVANKNTKPQASKAKRQARSPDTEKEQSIEKRRKTEKSTDSAKDRPKGRGKAAQKSKGTQQSLLSFFKKN